MTKPLVTRGPFDPDPGVLVRWMLKSGQVGAKYGNMTAIRDGIQLYVPADGRVVELNLKDAHEAGDLYVALEAHMENIAAPVEGMPVKDWLASNLAAVQEQIDNPIPVKSGVTVPVSFFKGEAWAAGVDPEFLEAMADVVEAWTNNGPHASGRHALRRDNVQAIFPGLAAALDKLAALNA